MSPVPTNQSAPFGLLDVLVSCRKRAKASDDAIYSSIGCPDIVAVLDRGIASLTNGIELNRDELKLLFAATGALQDTAIANGWGDEYLSLSSDFDALIECGRDTE